MSVVVVMRKPVGFIGGTLGLIQGLSWSILALLGILYYNGQIDVSYLQDRSDFFLVSLLCLYFNQGDAICSTIAPIADRMTPENVQVWVILYFAFNVVWTISSIYLLIELSRASKPMIGSYVWLGVTSCNMILDLAATIRFGLEYETIKNYVDSTPAIANLGYNVLLVAPALLMTLAARGFVLWLVNDAIVTFLIFAMLRERKEAKATNSSAHLSRQTSFTNPTMMWPDSNDRKTSDLYHQPIHNKNAWDPPTPTDTPTYPYSQSRPMSPTSSTPGGHTTPNQYGEPLRNIPSPDYSPPLNHRPMLPLRPALRKPPGQIGHIGRTVF